MYLAHNIQVVAYDCDFNNPQLWRHYNSCVPGGVRTIKFNQWGFSEILKKDLSTLNPVVALMDLPSGVGEYFQDFVQDTKLASLGYRITMASVLGRSKDSIIQLKRLIETCGNQVDYVVVKNLYWGEEEAFIKYNESKTRQSALELGAIELKFMRIVDWVYEAIDAHDLTFTAAVTHETSNPTTKARLSTWIPQQESELIKVGNFLGFESAKPRDRNNFRKT
ncbi:hypothetical protein [Nostoc sp. FACHB-190]|uniref:hypothetical protein n=1 Tax=Nostoc sp. FACHB-190 TaxID=2692838 RepID=UPI001F55A785